MNNDSNNLQNNSDTTSQVSNTVSSIETLDAPAAPVTPAVEPVAPVAPVTPAVEPVAPAAPVTPAVEPVAPAAPSTPAAAPVTPVVEPVAPAAPATPVAETINIEEPNSSSEGKLVINTNDTVETTEEKKEDTKPQTSNKKMVVFGVVILALVGILIYVISNRGSSGPLSPSESDNPTPIASPTSTVPSDATLLENVKFAGHSCVDSKCSFMVNEGENTINYSVDSSKADLLSILSNYEDYITLNIYYTQKDEVRTIVDYKILLKSTSEDVSNIKTEEELRNKIGLFALGSHTESLTLSRIGETGTATTDSETYTFIIYTFTTDNNIEYNMRYKNPTGSEGYTEGNKYTVTFDVSNDGIEYVYNITSIS